MVRKDNLYFGNIRHDVIELVAPGANRILDIGCGEGNTGQLLKEQGKAAEVVGVEKIAEVAEIARTRIDTVLCVDVEAMSLPNTDYFDYIIMGDVIEHLYDPWALVNNMGQYLKKGGFVIASVPNIRNFRIIKSLFLKGEWNYSSDGLLDDTHLRFFTKKTIVELFSSEDFAVERLISKFEFRPTYRTTIIKSLNNVTLHLFEDFLAFQYIVIARKL